MLLVLLCCFQLRICAVQAQAVFSHFMVENVKSWHVAEWVKEITVAQTAHIDAFALNMRSDDSSVEASLKHAFNAAQCSGFKLFFSFDYAGGGPWPPDRVRTLINDYKTSPAYYQHQDQPLVSTFEGFGNASDWTSIKAGTGCFFIPDWSSVGPAAALEPGVADGLFSWDAWPNGPNDMAISGDEQYQQALNRNGSHMPYMMPVSPWFFTNLPGYDKNWLWRGDDLWYDRWQQVLSLKPEFVQIVTWNDYGESHYIGPLHDEEYAAFSIGKAPFNYVKNMPHDGWRAFLPYLIDTYKAGAHGSTIPREGLVSWYRLTPKDACPDGGTTGNVANHGQTVFKPADIVQDKIFFSALLRSFAQVTVTIGGTNLNATWRNIPVNDVGVYHGNVPYDGSLGPVIVSLARNESIDLAVSGLDITTSCANKITNWNAWVGSQIQNCTDCHDEIDNSRCLSSMGLRFSVDVFLQMMVWILMVYFITLEPLIY